MNIKKTLLIYIALMLFFSLKNFAQTQKISGMVVDSASNVIPGAVIRVHGMAVATTSNAEGKFELSCGPGATTLLVSSIGYNNKVVNIAGKHEVKILLSSNTNELKQVVVTGYTRQNKAQTPGAITTLKAAQLQNVPVASFDVMLQGRVPGLYVGTPTGQPGEAGRVTLRGIGSINGDVQPLYIIDGIQISNTSFSGLNPDDFESVTVLKDAASTAQYGSRGANGVIVITTKKGKSWDDGKPRINYTTYFGISQVNTSHMNLMNTDQRLQFEADIKDPSLPGWEYSLNNPNKLVGGVLIPKTPQDYAFGTSYLDSLRKINTNWTKTLLRTGYTQSHALSLSGNDKNTNYYLSLSYLNQQGIAINSGLKRYSIRSDVQNTSGRLKSTLSIGLVQSNIQYIQNEGTASSGGATAGGGGLSANNPIAASYFALPYEHPDANNTGPANVGSDGLNQYANSQLKDTQLKSVISLNELFRLTNTLQLTGTVGLEYQQDHVTQNVSANSYYGQQVGNGNQGMYQDSITMNYRVVATGGIRYLKDWGNKNEIEINLLAESNRYTGTYNGYTGYGLTSQLTNTPAAITPGTATNNFIPNVAGAITPNNLLLSQIALFRYSYGNRFTLTGSLRRDGTSQVPTGARNIVLYALGGKWNLMEESFMANQHIFSNLQLRGSFGVTANGGGFTSDFGYRTLYGTSNYGGSQAVVPITPGNAQYTWEKNRIADAGIEFGFFDNRITGELDLYNRITNNLFVNKNLSLTTGFSSLATNSGSVRNRGLELSLDAQIVRTKDLKFSMGLNLAYNQNRVLSLGGPNMQFIDQISINQVGLPVGTFYAVRWGGVNPQTGAPIYIDKAGNPTNVYNADDAVPLKATWDPPVKGGVNLSLSYKRFDFSMLLSFIHGMSRLSYPYFYSHSADPNYRNYNQSVDMLKAWQKPGDVTPFAGAQYTSQITSNDVRSSDYIKLRNASINYSIPVNGELAKHVRGIKVFVQGQNLLTFTKWQGYDPEDANDIAQYEYPMPRIITAGINVSF